MRLSMAHARLLAAALRGQPHRALHWTLAAALRRPSSPQLQGPAGIPRRSVASSARSKSAKDRIAELEERHRPGNDLYHMSEEIESFWRGIAAGIEKPTARKEMVDLDLAYPAGIHPSKLSGRKADSMPHECLRYKQQYPEMVVLIRIGEFYEAFGLDAVLLMQFCGLNAMGTRKIPQAGCPVVNLRRTLDDLLAVGFSCVRPYSNSIQGSNMPGGACKTGLAAALPVVVEEVPMTAKQMAALKPGTPKPRFRGGVVTPESPEYTFGLIDREGDTTHTQHTAPPVMGVCTGVSGHKIVEVDVAQRRYTVEEGLTVDAVNARLHQGGLAPPLYIFRPEGGAGGSTLLTDASVEGEWELRIRDFSRTIVGSVRHYSGDDFVESLLAQIRRNLGLSPGTHFTRIEPDRRERPKRLFHCTACQLGIHRTRGVPSLLDAVVLAGTAEPLRAYLRELLLAPPPTEVAASLREACRILSELQVGLPRWTALLDPGQVVNLIEKRETGDAFFRDLKAALEAALDTMQRRELRPLAQRLLPAVVLKANLAFELEPLAAACRGAIEQIDAVIEPEAAAREPVRGPAREESLEGQLFSFFNHDKNSTNRGKVQAQLIEEQLRKVAAAGERVEVEVRRAYEPLVAAARASNDPEKTRPQVVHVTLCNAIWIRCYRNTAAHAKMQELRQLREPEYLVPTDHKNKPAKDCVSTADLNAAVADFAEACEETRAAVNEQLRRLAGRLQASNASLVGAVTLGLVAAAVEAHVQQATLGGWALPAAAPAGEPQVVRGMWPYWLDGGGRSTVRNDLSLRRMAVLTGPNMAGKSTVMRSLCAVAVLAACGLYAPVASASVPYTDAFMLRTFSADSPREGKSSFAIEMEEMKHVKGDVSANSLVLVDELGKGTEPEQGADIANAFVEFLAGVGCRGLFATHLHHMLDNPDADFSAVDFFCMELHEADRAAQQPLSEAEARLVDIARRQGGFVPTWRIIPGTCRRSLAITVMAQHIGPEDPVVLRAVQLMQARMAREKKAAAREEPAAARSHLQQPVEEPPRLLEPEPEQEPEALESEPEPEELLEPEPTLQTVASQFFRGNGGGGPAIEAAGPGRPIEDALEVMDDTARHTFDDIRGSSGSEDDAPLLADGSDELPRPQVVVLRPGQKPPPSTIGRSCVYVVRRPDGQFYVGETDDIKVRVATHRRRNGSIRGGPHIEVAYLVVPPQLPGKSAAKAVESQLIRNMQAYGFPLLSVADGRTKRSPRPA